MKHFWILSLILAIAAAPGWAGETAGKTAEKAIASPTEKTTDKTAEKPAEKSATVTLDVTNEEICVVFQQIEKQAGVAILAGSGVTGKVTATLEKQSVDKALELVCRNKDVRVQKVYVAAKQLSTVSATKLRDALDTLKVLEGTGYSLVSMDSDSKSATAFSKGLTLDSVQSDILKKNPDYKLVYLITAQKSSTAAGQRPLPQNYASAEQVRINALSSLSPDQQRQGILNGLRAAMDGPSGVSQDAVLDAVRQFVRTLPPSQRRSFTTIGIDPTPMTRPSQGNSGGQSGWGNSAGDNNGGGSAGNGGGNSGNGNNGGGGTITPPNAGQDDMPPPPPL